MHVRDSDVTTMDKAPPMDGCVPSRAVVNPPVDAEHCIRTKRRPADVVTSVAPLHPCRCPIVPGNPYPTVEVVVVPAPVVEHCPTPRLVAHPIPAVDCPAPASNGVWAPAHCYTDGPPSVYPCTDGDPFTVRAQAVIEHCKRHSRRLMRTRMSSSILKGCCCKHGNTRKKYKRSSHGILTS